jgi:quinol-cytochrome oxidoreductase complex cytochrome b subunit
LTFAVAASAAFLIISYFLDAPLEELANPNKVPNPAKAPWYFTGLQEMVSWGTPSVGGVILPGFIILSLMLLPYFDRDPRGVGIWFAQERRPVMLTFTAVFGYLIVVTIIGSIFRGENWSLKFPW